MEPVSKEKFSTDFLLLFFLIPAIASIPVNCFFLKNQKGEKKSELPQLLFSLMELKES